MAEGEMSLLFLLSGSHGKGDSAGCLSVAQEIDKIPLMKQFFFSSHLPSPHTASLHWSLSFSFPHLIPSLHISAQHKSIQAEATTVQLKSWTFLIQLTTLLLSFFFLFFFILLLRVNLCARLFSPCTGREAHIVWFYIALVLSLKLGLTQFCWVSSLEH